MSDNTPFGGFVVPEKNWFPMPNEWIDICAQINNLSELKVVQYVLRHTWGYHEYGIPKTISVDEFMHGRKRNDGTRMDKGTGLSNRSVIDGLRVAEAHGFLVCEIDTSDLARVKKSYALKMIGSWGEDSSPHEDVTPDEETTPQGCNIFTPAMKNLHPSYEESSHRSEKNTIEKHYRKTLEEKHIDATAPTTTETSLSENTPAQECEQQEVTHPSETAEPPQQQALMAPTSQQQSAKVEPPAPPASTRRKKGLPQLTLAGQHILELYDASKPIKRKTMLNADNIGRANRLAEAVERDEDFTEAVRLMRADPFLKQKNIAVDLDFVDRKIEKYLMQVDQLREAAAQAEQARALAEERAKTARPPTVVKPTALEQHMRDMEARYLQGGK